MEQATILAALLAAIKRKETVALATIVKASGPFIHNLGQKVLFGESGPLMGAFSVGDLVNNIYTDIAQSLAQGQHQQFTYAKGALQIFVEVQQRPPKMLIVGAGHVAQPLAQLAKMIDFEVIILDDRPQYANKQRFPWADRVIAASFTDTLKNWSIDNNTYIILVTRGHQHDVACLLEVINSPVKYIGMIGSKRRIKGVFDLLTKEQDISSEQLARIYAPIGLDIGAETPAEIAICIIAEIINLYRNGRGQSLVETLRNNPKLTVHPARKVTHRF